MIYIYKVMNQETDLSEISFVRLTLETEGFDVNALKEAINIAIDINRSQPLDLESLQGVKREYYLSELEKLLLKLR